MLTHSPTDRHAWFARPAPRGQPIAPTSPPPLVDKQTVADWGPQRLRSSSEGEAGEQARAQPQPPLPPEPPPSGDSPRALLGG